MEQKKKKIVSVTLPMIFRIVENKIMITETESEVREELEMSLPDAKEFLKNLQKAIDKLT